MARNYDNYPIRIDYCYRRKFDGKWMKSIMGFHDVKKALAFMKRIDSKDRESFVTGWICDYPDDNEWLFQRHVIHHPLID